MRAERPVELVRRFPGGRGVHSADEAARRVVVVHPGALPTAHYQELASALPDDSDMYVIDLERVPEYFQAALRGGAAETSIAGLAVLSARELRGRGLATRPWTLVGWSFGGVVGHTLTSLLTEDELPQRLVLLDSIAAVSEYDQEDGGIDTGLVLPWFAMYLGAKRGGTVDLPPGALPRDLDSALSLVLKAATASGVLLPSTSLPGLRKVYDTYVDGLVRNARLSAAHEPGPARVPLTLLRPERGLLDTPDPLGWEQLSSDLRVQSTSGDHYTMLRDEDAVRLIARAAVPVPAKAEPPSALT